MNLQQVIAPTVKLMKPLPKCPSSHSKCPCKLYNCTLDDLQYQDLDHWFITGLEMRIRSQLGSRLMLPDVR